MIGALNLKINKIQAEHFEIYQQAKEMEKKQIIDAYIKNRYIDTSLSNPIRTDEAEQYYNEKYNV